MKKFNSVVAGLSALAMLAMPLYPAMAVDGTAGSGGTGSSQEAPVADIDLSKALANAALVDTSTSYKDNNLGKIWTANDEVKLYFTDSQEQGINLQTLKLAKITRVTNAGVAQVNQQVIQPVDEGGHPVYTLGIGEYTVYNDGATVTADTKTFTVVKDATGPTIEDKNASDVVNGTQSVDLGYKLDAGRFTVADDTEGSGVNTKKLTITLDGQSYTAGQDIPAGIHDVAITTFDNVGNTSQAYTFKLKVSDTASAYKSVTLEEGDGVYFNLPDGLQKNSVVYVKPSAVLNMSVTAGYTLSGEGITQDKDAGTASMQVSATVGTYPVTVASDDGSTSVEFNVVVDNQPPTIDISKIPDLVTEASYTLNKSSITAEDTQSGVKAVTVTVDGEEMTGDTKDLPEGTHQIAVTVEDNLGNVTQAQKEVTVLNKSALADALLASTNNTYYKDNSGVVWYSNSKNVILETQQGYSVFIKNADGTYAKNAADTAYTPGDLSKGNLYVGSDSLTTQTDNTVAKITLKEDSDAPTGLSGLTEDKALVAGYTKHDDYIKSGAVLKGLKTMGIQDAGVGIDESLSYISVNGQKSSFDADNIALPDGDVKIDYVVVDLLGNKDTFTLNVKVSSDSNMSVEGSLSNSNNYSANGTYLYKKSDGAYPTITYKVISDSGINKVESSDAAVATAELNADGDVVVTFLKDGQVSFTVTNNFGKSQTFAVDGTTVKDSGKWSAVKTAGVFNSQNATVSHSGAYLNNNKYWYASKEDLQKDVLVNLVDTPDSNAPIDYAKTAADGLTVKGEKVTGAVSTKSISITGNLPDSDEYTLGITIYDVLGQSTAITLSDNVFNIDKTAPAALNPDNVTDIFVKSASVVKGRSDGKYYVTSANSGLKSAEELKTLVKDDESGVSKVEVQKDGLALQDSLSEGENNLDVVAYDNAGNKKTVYSLVVVVGNDPITGDYKMTLKSPKETVQAYNNKLYYKLGENGAGRPVFDVEVPVPQSGITNIKVSDTGKITSVDYSTGKVTVENVNDGKLTLSVYNGLGALGREYTLVGDGWSEIKTVNTSEFTAEENQGSGDSGTPYKKNDIWYYQGLTGKDNRSFEELFSYKNVSTGENNLPIDKVVATINGVTVTTSMSDGEVKYTGQEVKDVENNTKLALGIQVFDTLGNSKTISAQGDYRVDMVAPKFVTDDTQDLLKSVLSNSEDTVVKGNVTYLRTDRVGIKTDLHGLATDDESGVGSVVLLADGKEITGSEIPANTVDLGIQAKDNVGNTTVVDLGKVSVTDDRVSEDSIVGSVANNRKYYSDSGNLYYNIQEGLPEFDMRVKDMPLTGIKDIQGGDNTQVVSKDVNTGNFVVKAVSEGALSVTVINNLNISATVKIEGANKGITGVLGDNSWKTVKAPSGSGKVTINEAGKIYANSNDAKNAGLYNFSLKEGENAPLDIVASSISINGRKVDTVVSGSSGTTWSSDKKISGDLTDSQHIFKGTAEIQDILGNSWEYPISGGADLFYNDDSSPSITGISVSGGSTDKPDKVGRYTQIFNTEGTYTITADDGSEIWSAGVNSIHYKLVNSDGSTVEENTVKTPDASNTSVKGSKSITVKTSNHFRGYLTDVYAVDNVENRGSKGIDSEGIITEGVVLDGGQGISIYLTAPEHHDAQGNPLYNSDVKIGVKSRMSWSGFRNANVSVNDKEISSWNSNMFTQFIDSIFGVITGDVRSEVGYGAEGNAQQITASATDKAGKTITTDTLNGRRALFSIDRTAPKINVSWNTTKQDNLYGVARVATVTIDDVNVSTTDSKVVATDGDFGGWHQEGQRITGTVTFGRDTQNAQLVVESADLAGNKAAEYKSETFIIDMTKPTLTVTGNGTAKNGKYYNINRVFSVTVVDKNFDTKGLKVEGGQVGGWGQSGDTWHANITTNGEGEHQITVSASDKVNNASNQYQSDKYIQDTIKPEVDVAGLKDGASYASDAIEFTTGAKDENLDGRASYSTVIDNSGKETKVGGNQGLPEGGKSVSYGDIKIAEGKSKDGYYKARVHAEDLAGNVTDKEVNFTVNRYGGQYTYNTKDYEGKYLHKVGDITLTEVSYDRLDPNKARIIVTRNGLQMDVPTQDVKIVESGGQDGKPWQYEYTVSGKLFTKDGVYRIQVFSFTTTGRGNSSASIDYTFVIDNTAPTVAIEGISPNENIYSLGTPVSIITRDEYGLSEGSYNTSQGDSGIINNGTAVTKITSGVNIAVEAKAVDKAGNKSDYVISGVNVYSSVFQRFAVPIVCLVSLMVIALGVLAYARRGRNEKLLSKVR
jgi:hypothetical protein